MAIHRISFETMNFVSKGGTDGIEGFDTREETGHAWMDAVTCYGPGPKGIEHEGVTMGFGNMDKVVVCAKCGQAWGWRERLWRELMDWEKIQNSKRGFFTNIKRYIGF